MSEEHMVAKRPMSNKPLPAADSAIIVTSDGTLFRCHVEKTGGASNAARHWIFVRSDRTRFVGPIWTKALNESALCHLVEAWWDMTKALGRHFR